MPGFVECLSTWRAAADVCVSASRYEGLPFHMIEAMACGLPVIASRVKGHEDLIQEGSNGLLYPYGDERAFQSCVLRLREGGQKFRHEMGDVACKLAIAYDLDAVLPRVMDAFLGM